MKSSGNSKGKRHLSRRAFISNTATGAAVIAISPVAAFIPGNEQQAATWPPEASKLKFHMIGHAHIDPVWLWPWTEGISVVHSTFRSALDRMNETPDFTFISSSAQFYQWVADNDPAMLKEIQKRVAEGRWNIVGGWWVEPDVNIPCGESMVRQGLYGQLTLQRLLGYRAKVAFNPDSFGHTRTLPQIIKLQGMENYIFMRPAQHEKSIPSDLFWWEGPDGTRVLTYRIQISYNDGASVRNRLEKILALAPNQPMKCFMAYYGAGDHGGGATKENIASIEAIRKEQGAPKVFFSTPERYFKEAREEKLNLPVISDDLQHHAVGCYTAEGGIKKENRQAESALILAEKISAIGSEKWGAVYPKDELTSAWKRVLFLQFHDSLAGSSLFEHSQAAREGFGYALDIAHRATYMSVQKLEWQIPSEDPASQYLVAFNTHAWEIRANIDYDFNWAAAHKSSMVEDESGKSLAHQWTAGSTETGSRKKLVISTAIPPFGYRQLRLMDGDSFKIEKPVSAGENRIENEFLIVSFSDKGTLGIFDKEVGKEVFSGGENGCRAIVIDDPSDTWSHDIKNYSNEIGSFGNAKITVLENGPLRAAIRVKTTYGESALTIDWLLYSGSRNLEANVTLDWMEHLKMLKFSFPVEVESPKATYETPYGFIERSVGGDEEPGQRWIDISGKRNNGIYGLTVINDAKYGYSTPGNDLRISVSRSAVYAHHNPRVLDMKAEHLWMDQGIQTFRMMVIPHKDTWKENNIARIAEEFTAPPVSIYQGIHGGSMPKSGSFLSVDAKNIIVSSVKISENGGDTIIRMVETSGVLTEGTLSLRFPDRKWKGNFRPGEIKTLKINQDSGEIKEVNLLEE